MRQAEKYWEYKSPPIPELNDLPQGVFAGTENQWNSLSPGYRREIWRDAMKRLKKTTKSSSKKPATLPKGKNVAQIAFPAPLIAAAPLSTKEDMTTEPDLITNYIDAKTYEEYVSKKKIPGLPQFLRDAALRHPPVTLDKLKDILDAQTGTRREWVMPDNSPEAVARRAAEKIEKQKLQIFATDDNVGVTVSQMVDGSPKTLAFYANMAEFRNGHDFKTYPFKECRSDKEQTVILVTAKPWAGKEPAAPKVDAEGNVVATIRKPRGEGGRTKADIIGDMLLRSTGATTKEVLEAMGWPTVSMPAQAKAAGLKLRKEKVDGVTRYWGTK